jgi:hypothetical protein
MSTDFCPLEPLKLVDVFDGRLAKFLAFVNIERMTLRRHKLV